MSGIEVQKYFLGFGCKNENMQSNPQLKLSRSISRCFHAYKAKTSTKHSGTYLETFCRTTMPCPLFQSKLKIFIILHNLDHLVFTLGFVVCDLWQIKRKKLTTITQKEINSKLVTCSFIFCDLRSFIFVIFSLSSEF